MNFIGLKISGWKLIEKLFYLLFKKYAIKKNPFMGKIRVLGHIRFQLNTSTFIFSWRYFITLQLMWNKLLNFLFPHQIYYNLEQKTQATIGLRCFSTLSNHRKNIISFKSLQNNMMNITMSKVGKFVHLH